MKSKGSTAVLVITVMLFAVALTMAALALYLRTSNLQIVNKQDLEPSAEEVNVSKFKIIDEQIQNSYLKEYDRDQQMDAIYRSMLDNLDDPYSRYMNAEELKQLQLDINSTFTGTGIVFIEDESGFIITDVIPGGPADVAGVQEGDVIQKVDGVSYKSTEDMIEALKGDPGVKVELIVIRDGEEKTFDIIRGDVKGVSVDSKKIADDKLGYIKIRLFGEDTYSLFDTALSAFEKENLAGLILDLRDNPGGLFDVGVSVADRLLPEGMLAYTVNKSAERENYNSDDRKTGMKLVVLINENTASAAEMVAAAVQVAKAGDLVGAKTYGKGLIQETHVFEDGSAINLTTKEFYPAEGVKIDGIGVSPDYKVSNYNFGSKDQQLEKAISLFDFSA